MHRPTRGVVAVLAAAVVMVGCGSSGSGSAAPTGVVGSGASYHPKIDPASFRAVVDNPWFPLKPGSTGS